MMDGAQLRKERQKLKLSQAQLGALMKVTANTVARWEREERAIPPIAEVALEHVKLTAKKGSGRGR